MGQSDTTILSAAVLRDWNLALTVANTLLRDYDRAHEAVQESVYRALLHADSFDSNRPVRPWFLRIVRNVCLNELKRGGKQVDMPDLKQKDTALDGILRAELSKGIRAAVHTLSDSYRAVVHLRYDKGYHYRDIASELRIPIGTTKTLLHRAHKALRAELIRNGTA